MADVRVACGVGVEGAVYCPWYVVVEFAIRVYTSTFERGKTSFEFLQSVEWNLARLAAAYTDLDIPNSSVKIMALGVVVEPSLVDVTVTV